MKRGELNVWVIIGMALLVIVLVIVIWGILPRFDYANTIFKWLPNFGFDNKTVENLEIFRYDISNGNVMYYDGTNWNGFDGELRAGDKKVNYNTLKKNFENHYYFTKRGNAFEIEQGVSLIGVLNLVNSYNNNVIEIEKNLEDSSKFLGALNLKSYEIYVPNDIVSGDVKDLELALSHIGKINCEKCKIGDVRFQLMNRDMSRGSPINFVLGLDDRVSVLYTLYNGDDKPNKILIKGDLLTRMFNYMKEWRNSVFSKPFRINYMTNDDAEVTNHFCGQFGDNKYIIVDLSKGVDSDAKC